MQTLCEPILPDSGKLILVLIVFHWLFFHTPTSSSSWWIDFALWKLPDSSYLHTVTPTEPPSSLAWAPATCSAASCVTLPSVHSTAANMLLLKLHQVTWFLWFCFPLEWQWVLTEARQHGALLLTSFSAVLCLFASARRLFAQNCQLSAYFRSFALKSSSLPGWGLPRKWLKWPTPCSPHSEPALPSLSHYTTRRPLHTLQMPYPLFFKCYRWGAHTF